MGKGIFFMEHSLLQARRRARRIQRRALCLMIPFFLLVFAGVAGYSWLALHAAEASLSLRLENTLTSQAHARADALGAWAEELREQARRITDADVIRLFTAEVHKLGDTDVEPLLHVAQAPTAPDTSTLPQTLQTLAPRVPLLHSLLADLLKRGQFLSARLADTRLRCFLSTHTPPTPLTVQEQEYARKALESAHIEVSPVQMVDGRSRITLFSPLIAPDYLQQELGTAPLGLLCLDYDVTDRLSLQHADMEESSGRLLQQGVTGLEELVPADQGGLRPLPDWKTDDTGALPLAVRTSPEGTDVFSLALPVEGIPWLAEEELPQALAGKEYREQRRSIVIHAAAALVLTLCLLGLFWWRLRGKGEQEVAEELGRLYRTVNRQKQLLHGITQALIDGILLQNQQGVIQYVNPAFAALTGRDASEILGQPVAAVLGAAAAEQLKTHTDSVFRHRSPAVFTGTLDLGSGEASYRITCSPYCETNGEITGMVCVFQICQQADACAASVPVEGDWRA